MNNGAIMLKMDSGCYVYINISNIKSILSMFKYIKDVSSSVTFFISESRIIIRSSGRYNQSCMVETIIYNENLLDFRIGYSDMMKNNMIEDYDTFIEITFSTEELIKSIGKVSKGSSLIISKESSSTSISIYSNESKIINRLSHSRNNTESDIYTPMLDSDNYIHIMTLQLSSFFRSIGDLSKFHNPDGTIQISYGDKEISMKAISGENYSDVYFGKNIDLFSANDSKVFILSQILSLMKINGIINDGVLKCYISHDFNEMLLVVALADIGVCSIGLTPQSY